MIAALVGLAGTVALAVGIMLVVALPHLRSGSRILTPDGERAMRRARAAARQRASTAGSGLRELPGAAVRPSGLLRRIRSGLRHLRSALARSVRGLLGLLRGAASGVLRGGRRAASVTGPATVATGRGTVRGARRLHGGASRAYAPLSAYLHSRLDALEERDARPTDSASGAAGESPHEPQPAARHATGPIPVIQEPPAPTIVGGASTVGSPRPYPVDSGPIPEVPVGSRVPTAAAADADGAGRAADQASSGPRGEDREAGGQLTPEASGSATGGSTPEDQPDRVIDLRDPSPTGAPTGAPTGEPAAAQQAAGGIRHAR